MNLQILGLQVLQRPVDSRIVIKVSLEAWVLSLQNLFTYLDSEESNNKLFQNVAAYSPIN
jgi:hypothetical protein